MSQTQYVDPLAASSTSARATGSTPQQIEQLFRDVNSMVDTLGLNARSLAAFTAGHESFPSDVGRAREDLDGKKAEGWCLGEVEDLAVMVKEEGDRLESERLADVGRKIEEAVGMNVELQRLRKRQSEVQKLVRAYQNPEEEEQGGVRSAKRPLSEEQTATLLDLRRDYASFQSLLAQAEDGVSLLRAKLASAQAASTTSKSKQTPTIEAVVNTIAKMTKMAEEKRGDLDVLEARLRGLRGAGRRTTADGDVDELFGRMSLGSRNTATPPRSSPRRSLLGSSQIGARRSGNGSSSSPLAGRNQPRRVGARREGGGMEGREGSYELTYSDDEEEGDGGDGGGSRDGEEEEFTTPRSSRSLVHAKERVRGGGGGGGDGGRDGNGRLNIDDVRVAEWLAKERGRRKVLGCVRRRVVERFEGLQ